MFTGCHQVARAPPAFSSEDAYTPGEVEIRDDHVADAAPRQRPGERGAHDATPGDQNSGAHGATCLGHARDREAAARVRAACQRAPCNAWLSRSPFSFSRSLAPDRPRGAARSRRAPRWTSRAGRARRAGSRTRRAKGAASARRGSRRPRSISPRASPRRGSSPVPRTEASSRPSACRSRSRSPRSGSRSAPSASCASATTAWGSTARTGASRAGSCSPAMASTTRRRAGTTGPGSS